MPDKSVDTCGECGATIVIDIDWSLCPNCEDRDTEDGRKVICSFCNVGHVDWLNHYKECSILRDNRRQQFPWERQTVIVQ